MQRHGEAGAAGGQASSASIRDFQARRARQGGSASGTTLPPHLQCALRQVAVQHEHRRRRQRGCNVRLAQQRRQQGALQQGHVGHAGRHLAVQAKHHAHGGGCAAGRPADARGTQAAGRRVGEG